MLSNSNVKDWLSNFDEGTKATMQQVIDAEAWPCDSNIEVQDLLDSLSSINDIDSSSPRDSEKMLMKFKKAFEGLEVSEIIELQAQFIFPRSLKMFGDIVNLDAEIAQKVINSDLINSDIDVVAVGASTLVNRILFLSKMSIFQRIFTDKDQLKFIMEAVENYEI